MKTHFANIERGNENNSHDDWSEPLCGMYSEKIDDNWLYVDCKKCLKARVRYEETMKDAMDISCKQMEEFVDFHKKIENLKTKGGYKVSGFKDLDEPIDRFPLKPMIYEGKIYDPIIKMDVFLRWDESGRCSNHNRSDCFIEVP